MPFNGSGVYTPPGADFPAVAGTLIESAKYNNVVTDVSSALTNCITKDGQTTPTSNIPMGGFRVTGAGNASSAQDLTTKEQTIDALAASTGAVMVGADDGASGSLWTTVQGFINKVISSAGSSVVGFIQAGAGAVTRTVQARLRDLDGIDDYGANTDTALSNINTLFQDGVEIRIPRGTRSLAATATFTGQRMNFLGAGQHVSIITFDPASTDVALEFNNPAAGGMFQGSVCKLGFSSGNSVDKTAINLVNCADFDIGYIGINTWAGSGSIGVKTAGRQTLDLHHSQISCARPVVFSQNAAFPAISVDHYLVQMCELSSTLSTAAVIEFESGVSIGNTTLRQLAITGGKDGIRWSDTTSTAASFNLKIEDVRFEQGADATGWSIKLDSTAQNLQSLQISNVNTDLARNGIRLRNCQRVILDGVDFPQGAGKTGLDITMVSGSRLSIRNCFVQTGTTMTITNGRCVSKEISGLTFNEEWVFDAGFSTAETRSDVYWGGTPFAIANGAATAIADNSFTGTIFISTSEDVSAIFMLMGPTANTREVSDPNGFFSVTAGTVSSVNIYWDAGPSRYMLQNNRGSQITVAVFRIGTTA